ncbi:MAG: biosynthetic-type acetolactate synthase large subunit, partial [Candidatus Adiutrix sp.]|nr:biosynthetic-type acetolactate synthase large subunit [Candidatus Adiutrix sp.]
AFQEADIYGITIPITKYNYLVKEVERLPMALAEAFYLAASGRPGVVLVEVPTDVQKALMNTPEATGEVRLDGYDPDPALDEGQVAALVEALRHSRRPVAYIGGGVSAAGAEAELLRLVTDSGIPVASTLMAKGAFPDDHPLALGLAGMHGAKYANLAIHESDLILCLGARFDDRVAGNVRRFAPGARVAHVDIDGAAIEKRVQTHLPVVGHLKRVLARLLELVVPVRRPEWLDRVSELKARHPLVLPADEDGAIRPQSVIRAVDRAAGDGAVIVTDVGQHQMWAAQLITSRRPRHFLSSGGLGTMGYGLPAALGAQVGRPGARVVLITGDGGFQMNIQELATIRENNLPVKVVIVNNGCLGMVRQWQEFFYRRRYSQTVWSFMPDFAAIAGGYGLPGRRITEPGEVVPAIEELLESPGPGLLDCRVVMEENVLPMIPAGGGQDEFYEA